jgi:diguanylate cyclase (GGDEF)-like protein
VTPRDLDPATAGATAADERLRPRWGQFVLAAVVIGLIAGLALTGARQAATVQARTDALAGSEATRTNIVYTMRESLALSFVVERYLGGEASRRDVQIARALLGQRLGVIGADGVSAGDAAPASYREALFALDDRLEAIPAGTLSPVNQIMWNSSVDPLLDSFVRESRHLGDLESVTFRSEARAAAEDQVAASVRESVLLASALIAALALAIWVAVDVRRYFRRVDAAITAERDGLEEARAALERSTVFERGQARVLERMATGAPLHEQLYSVAELASRASGGLPFRLMVADRIVLSEPAQLRPAGDELIGSWQVGDGINPAESGQLELVGTAGDVVSTEVDAIARQCCDLAALVLEHDRSAALLEYQANHDALTGLVNRGLLLDRIGEAMRRRERSGEIVGILFCDLERFKEVNDSLGHDAGDDVLIEVAGRFRQAVRLHDTVARLGGDEFVVLATWMNDEAELAILADRLQESLVAPITVRGAEVTVGVTIGSVVVDDLMIDARTALHAADVAMYRGKGASARRV